MSNFDLEHNDFPICPHCGEQDQDWWDGLHDPKNDGDSWEANCGSCGNDYTITMHVSHSFSTEIACPKCQRTEKLLQHTREQLQQMAMQKRTACQTLIEAIGAKGPESVEDAAERAAIFIKEILRQNKTLRRDGDRLIKDQEIPRRKLRMMLEDYPGDKETRDWLERADMNAAAVEYHERAEQRRAKDEDLCACGKPKSVCGQHKEGEKEE